MIVMVAAENIDDAVTLAKHAEAAGADAVSSGARCIDESVCVREESGSPYIILRWFAAALGERAGVDVCVVMQCMLQLFPWTSPTTWMRPWSSGPRLGRPPACPSMCIGSQRLQTSLPLQILYVQQWD